MTDRRLLVAAPIASIIYEIPGRLHRPDRRIQLKVAHRASLARAWLDDGGFDAVLVAPRLEDGEGAEVARAAARVGAAAIALAWPSGWPEPPEDLLDAADDLLSLPDEWWRFGTTIERAVRHAALRHRGGRSARSLDEPRIDDLVAVAPAMRSALDLATRLASGRRPLVILGEPGTGRRALAAAIHAQSSASARPLAVLPASAWPDDLLDDALEGRVPPPGSSALTIWEAGTLLIRDATDLTRPRQAQIVRRLEALDDPPRLIATARHDPREDVPRGRVLPEFAALLGTSRIELPPLSDRAPGDRAALAGLFLGLREPGRAFAPDALEWIASQPWPGNLHELSAFVEAVALTSQSEIVRLAHLPMPAPPDAPEPFEAPEPEYLLPWDEFSRLATERFEADYFLRLIRDCQGRVDRCAQRSGLSRKSVSLKLSRYGIDKAAFRRPRA